MTKFKEAVLIVALAAISAAPRLAGLGDWTSIDEPFWLRQGSNFYYALGQRDFQNTIYEYHPAVTTMWIVAAGMLAYFPQYRALGEGYLKPGKFDLFLPAQGKDPLQLLIVSRTLQVLIVVFLLLVVYWLLRLLFDRRSAFVATTLVSISPFLLGHSRLLNHEALLGLFLLISLLSLLAYLNSAQNLGLLAVSFVSAGLAQLTKSSGIVLFPLVVLVFVIHVLRPQEASLGRRVFGAAGKLGLWLLGVAASYVLFWPGMWVAPVTMLTDVYGNALSYTFEGARVSVLPGVQPGGIDVASLIGGVKFYLNDLVWRTTPITWLGVLLALVLAVLYQARKAHLTYRLLILYSLVLAVGFILLFGYQRGPKPPHYTLTSYICLDLIAGIGLSHGWAMLSERFPRFAGAWPTAGVLGSILALQLASSAAFYPYFVSYYNPLLEALQPGIQNPTLVATGYGVGLDQAAAYLDRKSDANQMTVMSANGYGSFSYYFAGHTVPMNDLILTDPLIVNILRGSQYAVVDYYNQRRNNLAADLDGIAPEKTIWINGIDFLRIYRAADLLARVDQGVH